MAKFSNASGSLYLNVYIEPSTQNIANNTTVVNWRMTVSRTGAYYTYNEDGSSTLSLDLNGGRVHTSNPRWRTSGEEFQMASGSTTVGHNADGRKSFGFSATFNPNNGLHGVITVSGNIGLTTIPRATTPTLSNSNPVMGQAITISLPRASDSFTHYVYHDFLVGSWTKINDTPVGTSLNWTLPLEEYALRLMNATSGDGRIKVDTYNGGTYIGSKIVNFTASVPDSAKPTFSGVTLTDTNTAVRSMLTGNNFLQIISNIQVSFNGASGSYGSSITGYKAEIVGKNQTTDSNGGNLGMMNFNGTETIRASVVDSRGRWSDTIDVTINVIEYFAPILSFTALRTRETPNIIQIVRNAKIAPITLSGSQKNVMTLAFKVAPLGSTSYTADNGSASGSWTTLNTLTNSPANLAVDYPANKSFTIIGTLSDKFTSVEFSATVATKSVVMSYDKDGRVGVGKIAENGPAGSLDVAGNIYAGGKQIQQHRLTDNVGNNIMLADYTDLNTAVQTGIYSCNSPRNRPDGTLNGFFIVNAENTAMWIHQFFAEKNTGRLFSRFADGNVTTKWTPWIEYAKTDHPMLQEKPLKTITQGMPYGLNATITRKDNLVTITLNRRITNIDVFEYREMVETIPSGYRPTAEVHMVIVPNAGIYSKVPSILHFATDGKIRVTNGTAGQHVYTGTVTYITNDSYPS